MMAGGSGAAAYYYSGLTNLNALVKSGEIA
jgi:hypothetical protein